MEKMEWGFEGVEPLWGTLLLASCFADWLNVQFKTWYFQLPSVKICKPFKARTVSLYGTWHDGTPVPDASKCACIVCAFFLCCQNVCIVLHCLGSGVTIPVVVYGCLNDSCLLGFRQPNCFFFLLSKMQKLLVLDCSILSFRKQMTLPLQPFAGYQILHLTARRGVWSG